MALPWTTWVIVLLFMSPHLGETARDGTTLKRSIGEPHQNRTTPKWPKHRPLKSWSMPMIRVEDYKARHNLGQNKNATQKWKEMVQQSRARRTYLNQRSNRLVGIEAWDLPQLVRSQDGNFMVEIEIGSPPQVTSFLVDTGSDLTWMQCKPCDPCMNSPHSPYPMEAQGSFVDWVKCKDNLCQELFTSENCDSNPQLDDYCTFHEKFADETEVSGTMGIDTINYNNDGIGESKAIYLGMTFQVHDDSTDFDGILGLSQSPLGMSFQLKSEFDNVFSHCLVNPNSGRTSKFTMGTYPSALSQHLVYTPMEAPIDSKNRYYYVTLQAILVGGEDLGIDPSLFAQDNGAGGMMIDTGSPLTFIPKVAFSLVADAYRSQVRLFPVVSELPEYPFCFDTSFSFSTKPPILPDLTFKFANDVDLVVTSTEAFKSLDAGTRLCLAMNTNDDDSGVGFSNIGSVFMQNQYVVYDNERNTIGIAPWNCLNV